MADDSKAPRSEVRGVVYCKSKERWEGHIVVTSLLETIGLLAALFVARTGEWATVIFTLMIFDVSLPASSKGLRFPLILDPDDLLDWSRDENGRSDTASRDVQYVVTDMSSLWRKLLKLVPSLVAVFFLAWLKPESQDAWRMPLLALALCYVWRRMHGPLLFRHHKRTNPESVEEWIKGLPL